MTGTLFRSRCFPIVAATGSLYVKTVLDGPSVSRTRYRLAAFS